MPFSLNQSYLPFFLSLLLSWATLKVKFYPLYFMVDCNMSPAEVQGIYLCVPIAMLVCGSLATRIASGAQGKGGIGRVQTIVLFKALGVASLFIFIFLQRFRDLGRYALPFLLVPPFLLSTSFTDAT